MSRPVLPAMRLHPLYRSLCLMPKPFTLAAMLSVAAAPVLAGADTPSSGSPGTEHPDAAVRESAALGATVEKQLPLYVEPQRWLQDPALYEQNRGDRIETQQVKEKVVRTVKLANVVPPIHYGSGEAEIPAHYVDLLRDVLARMQGRRNVRLHFLGHSDNAQLRRALLARYGDNVGLSRERAGTAAEYFKKALGLPAESISFDGAGEAQPVASNRTDAGKAQNRRVEVQVWYDELDDVTVEKEVVVTERLNRVKVCRVETVCKLDYKAGHARRTRVKNLVAPLRFNSEESPLLPEEFRQQVLRTLEGLGDKQSVVLKLVGHTDNLALASREERIYGTALGLSKARARRAALALQDALKLPSAMLESDGRGASQPVASNESDAGRALNRRIEVEFWYDDALKELPEAPQMCPEAAPAETVTRVHEPAHGPLPPVAITDGQPVLDAAYAERLRAVLAEVKDKSNVRLRFIGHIANERLDRRAAMIYGDDIGLSAARARRVMESLVPQLGLAAGQAEFEGRGYVQTDDVVNAGFVEAATSRVDVQVVYDEQAQLDDLDGLDIQRLTREVDTANPYALNLMRITVDGKPVDDPARAVPDVERCVDVALEKADVQFKYDNLDLKPRLNVTAWPNTVRYSDDGAGGNRVQFRLYSNYPAFIERAEVRLFESGRSLRDTPLAVVPVDPAGNAEWQANFASYQAPGRELKYLLRVYDKKGRYDETAEQTLWVVDTLYDKADASVAEQELLVGYGENRLAQRHIPLHGGTIKVHGTKIPAGRQVFVAGHATPVSEKGEFVVEEILPNGLHTVEVAVLDGEGNGELFLRDLALEKSDWFTVAIADLTASANDTNGPAALLQPAGGHTDDDLAVDGRLAFYTRGKFGNDWQLTASADTLEGPVEDIFSNFMQKSPDALFRRIDPDYALPTYGDDSTVEEDAPTLGKFYLKLRHDDDYGLWGNFKVGYTDNTLAHVDRSLYGANVHWQSEAVTGFGEKKFLIDGFAADPGTIAGRDEFRGTGGSLYYLRHQDVLQGSERVRIEVRDKVSGLVLGVKHLTPALDYDIDYLQGRILLNAPLSATSADGLLVASEAGSGNEVYLVTRYEYSTGFDDVGNLSAGGRLHYWVGDVLKIGLTASDSSEAGNASRLAGTDLTLRKSAQTWVKAELSQSEGEGSTAFLSQDGGYNFGQAPSGALPGAAESLSAEASRFEASVDLKDVHAKAKGTLTAYQQSVEAGFTAPGQITPKDTEQVGAALQLPVTDKVGLRARLDSKEQTQGVATDAAELNVDYRVNERWQLSSGLRQESRADHSPVVPLTQVQGDRSDMVLRADYDSKARWSAYGFVQDTVASTGNQEDNGRVGAGGAWRATDRLKVSGEASGGDLGMAAKAGTEYLVSDRSNVYLNYALENERTDNGVRAQRGSASTGVRSRWSDTTSVYLEEKYTHGDVPTGLTHATGIDLAPNDRWNYGASLDVGTLRDNLTGAELERQALGLKAGYAHAAVTFATQWEVRLDDRENPDLSREERTTWLTRNSVKYQVTPDWRLIGKLNLSESKSSLGEFYDGNFLEAVLGYGYRPVAHDRLNALLKYTYFYNLPAADQVTIENTAAEFVQKSHVASLDTVYDLTPRWSVGGKLAYRLGQVSQDRANPQFFDSRASLVILRADWHVIRHWDAVVEARQLDLPDAGDSRSGMLVAGYRHLNDHVKFGAGYNFTTFSDDLTDLSYDHQGFFINLVGKL
jgi:flagellar motor protein MotB